MITVDRDMFVQKYDVLQRQWRQLAIDRKRHYLEYLPPHAPVDFVLVAKMPSISERDAVATPFGEYPPIDPPKYNLLISLGDLILNYGAQRHLCGPGESYYLTDLGKCALPPKLARGKLQESEFNAWYPMLLKELKLVAKPEATVIPVGSAAGNFLKGQSDFPYLLREPILHWSTAATVAAKMASSMFPAEWKEFQQTSGWEDLLASTEEVLVEAGLGQHINSVHDRFVGKFRDIHRHYMFTYKKELSLRRPDVGN